MRMLRGKKGMDYAAMMVLVTLILVVAMYIQLSAKLEPFQVSVGESQIALLNAYQGGENALLYVDQSAKFASYRALDEIARSAGMTAAECGAIEGQGAPIPAWTAKGKNCLSAVQPFELFSAAFNKKMNEYLDAYKGALLPQDNYELLMKNGAITGTAISSAVVAVQPPPAEIAATIGQFTIPFTTQQLVKVRIGEYAFKPSFTVPVDAKLDTYAALAKSVAALYDCANAKNFDYCVAEVKPPFSVVRSTVNPDYVIATAKNPAASPYGPLADVVFALYAPAEPPAV